MSRGITKNNIWWSLFLLPALGLVAALGCSTSTGQAETDSNVVASAPLASVGIQVGDRITPFTLRMIDGSTLTSNDLLSRNRPTFLFFFKKG